ncbi:DUF2145 domain-containing protein [Glaciecola sp. MH2013]|uniref:DUF2145 domain-containing protein n=1 Tax=Glaciecola sp. MH2013 TaxID=2785524 RepID=UPI0018A12225|nr:DUF2145 domain-containing protein [Glaciecola sp. MH2013]MBF7074781.1 DUF2145 domain-containing protein [Glaciecola sp. MH2013]
MMGVKKQFVTIILAFIGIAFTGSYVQAGSQQHTEVRHKPEVVATFAKNVEKYAASKGARAFIVARVGRPVKDLPKGIKFTHTAIAVYSAITLGSGEVVNGYAIHNLYQNADSRNRSDLIVDYPVDFFWGAYELKAGIVIPKPYIQGKLIELIKSGDNRVLHNPKYTVLASPFNSMYQNCTEHTLDMLNAAIYDTTNIAQLKANTQAHFSAQRVKTSRFKLLLGSALMEDITTRDHQGKVKTATFTSIAHYLNQYDLAQNAVTLDANLNAIDI